MNIALCGFPRSGSTMLYNMLRSTVKGYTFNDKEESAVTALKRLTRPMITKFPSDVFYVDEILQIDPEIRFLVTIRDPRSVLCSKHATTGDQYKVGWNRTYFGKPAPGRFKYQSNPGRYRSHWGLVDWYKAIKAMPGSRIIKYEDIIRVTEAVKRSLMRDLDLDIEGRFEDFHKHDIPPGLSKQLNGVREPEATRLQSWREHPQRIKEQFTECPYLFEMVRELGYEGDDEWFKKI